MPFCFLRFKIGRNDVSSFQKCLTLLVLILKFELNLLSPLKLIRQLGKFAIEHLNLLSFKGKLLIQLLDSGLCFSQHLFLRFDTFVYKVKVVNALNPANDALTS